MKRTRVLLGIGLAAAFVAAATPYEAVAAPATAASAPSATDPPGGGSGLVGYGDLAEAPTSGARGAEHATFSDAPGVTTYLIRFRDAAVPAYTGNRPGLAATATEAGEKLDTGSRAVQAYAQYLRGQQADFIQRIGRATGRAVNVKYQYQFAVNGMAVDLTEAEARAIARDPSVLTISPDKVREIQSDSGPAWIGAPDVWDGSAFGGGTLPSYRGEKVVIGVIDTGISPGNSSFAATGDDGYTVINERGHYYGVCVQATDPNYDDEAAQTYDPAFPCNSKLIGAYDFTGNGSAVDYDEHGSHTASTAGGNVVQDVVPAPTVVPAPEGEFDISGVAPHANIIAYLGCCTLGGLTKSIDQAMRDEVDVINYSIGSSDPSADPWTDFDTLGFLNARAAGIFVAVSNGNDGPGDATTGSPADAPWLTAVGASTHDRVNSNTLTVGGGGPVIVGKAVSAPLGATPIVDAADFGDTYCDAATGNEANFTGKIVICVRGGEAGTGRVAKSENVKAQGAVGFVLVNDEANNLSLLGDQYAVPGVFITYDDGVVLRAWIDAHPGATASIAGTDFVKDAAAGDIMASFSSRGPNRKYDIVSPSVTAPGVDILAAVGKDSYISDEHGFISGTSMASPHVAGAGALLTQVHPAWTPAQMQSALMTTAVTTVRDFDDPSGIATPYEQGSGRIDVAAASRAGLVFDEDLADYEASNPDVGGDVRTLNIPSFANTQCVQICSWTRQATVPDDAGSDVPAGVTWTASVDADPTLDLTVDLTPGAIDPGDTLGISVQADLSAADLDTTLFGRITLTPSNPAVPTVTMPVAVVRSNGVLPQEIVEIPTRRDAGSAVVPGIISKPVTEFQGSLRGLVKATQTDKVLAQDPTNAAPYDDLTKVDVTTIDVPAGSSLLVAEVTQADMNDLDLYVGTGPVGAAGEVCSSATEVATERCVITDPAPGQYWILTQNWEASAGGALDHFTLATGVVNEALGNGGLDGPAGNVPAAEPYDLRVHWDLADAAAGDIYYGSALLGSAPGSPGDIGSFPVRIERLADDVTKSASVDAATLGDQIDYTIDVQPNVTPTDLAYTITDTIPAGVTLVPGSVTGGGEVSGNTITWHVAMPTSVGVEGSYVQTTSADPECATAGEFFDLANVSNSFVPDFDGDTTTLNAFGNAGPFEFYGHSYSGLTVAEDGFITIPGGYGSDGDVGINEPWQPEAIPDDSLPNGVIAPLWGDYILDAANGHGVRLAADPGNVAIVQWDDPYQFDGGAPGDLGAQVGTFQAVVYNAPADGPEIVFSYDTIDALPAEVTVGVENPTGTAATALVADADPTGVIDDGFAVCYDYVGPDTSAKTLTYSVTVDENAPSGVVTNEAVHVTDDPYAEPEIASADVDVTGVPENLPLEPARLADTRPGFSTVDGQFAGIGLRELNSTLELTVAGRGGVPADATSAVLNVTGVDSAAAGYLTVWPCGSPRPTASNVNLVAGGTVPNAVVAKIGTDGKVCIFTSQPTHLVVDVNGAFPDGSPYEPLVPARLMDTRDGAVTVDGQGSGGGKVAIFTTKKVRITGRGGVPSSVNSAVLNVTATNAAAPGFVTVYPCDADRPTASNLNIAPGVDVANMVITKTDAAGDVCLYASQDVDLIVDVNGYLPVTSTYQALVPARLMDTRPGFSTIDGQNVGVGQVPINTITRLHVAGRAGVPANATSVVLNVTVTEPVAPGFVTVFPCGITPPLASNVNYGTGQTVPNSAIVKVGEGGDVCLLNSQPTQLVVDVSGAFIG